MTNKDAKALVFKADITLVMSSWAMKRAEEFRDGILADLKAASTGGDATDLAILRTTLMAGLALSLNDLIDDDLKAGNMKSAASVLPPEGYR